LDIADSMELKNVDTLDSILIKLKIRIIIEINMFGKEKQV